MLKTYKEKLLRDYETEKDLLIQFLGDENPQFLDNSAVEAVKEFIIEMPDIVFVLNQVIRNGAAPPQLNVAFGFLVSYLMDPRDLLPVETFGFFGNLDDAYLAGRIVAWILPQLDDEKLTVAGIQRVWLEEYVALKQRASGFLPPDVRQHLDTLSNELFQSAQVIAEQFEIGVGN
jgi:uncharacterized membrane protein YkvA (DUF1232 family)